MKNIDAVTEVIFEKKDKPDLIASFNDRFDFNEPRFPFAHLVYVKKHLLYVSHGTEMENDKPCFKEELDLFMNKFQKKGFGDILFFVSKYSCYPPLEIMFNKKFTKDGLVDYCTRDSYGYFMWSYQIEYLIKTIYPYKDLDEVKKLVYGIQNEDSTAIETVKKLSVGEKNLYDILQERGQPHCSCGGAPNFKSAYILYEALNSQGKCM